MNRFNNVIFGQKAFILNDENQLLVLKRKNSEVFNDYWDVPGGKVEEGNTLKEAIAREISEETGLHLKKILVVLTTRIFKGSATDSPIVFRNIYLCNATGKVTISDEHSEFKWIKTNEISQYKFPEDVDWQEALKKLPSLIGQTNLKDPISTIF